MRPAMKVGFAAIIATCLSFAACTKKEEAPVEQVPPTSTAPVDPAAPQQLDPNAPAAAPAPHGEPSSSLKNNDAGSLGRAGAKSRRGVLM